jgi:RNA polymerase sigma factor (sigma-70 family)
VFVQAGSTTLHPDFVEAHTLTHAEKRGIFARRSPLLKFQGDEALVALTREGHQHAFESLVERYQSRLLGFCRQMLGSTEDAEDVLQEVFVAAYNAMIADERPIAARPWLYRIARNRCLNHLRKPTADGQDTMDTHPHLNGVTTLERVQHREEFRSLLSDVGNLPETQRSALLLREIDAMSYEEIAQAMDTTVPGVKSLLVRARIALAESSQARQLTCDEVRLQLAEAAEGLAKLDGPARRHIKACEPCKEFRSQLRSDSKALAALFPAGPLLLLKGVLIGKLSGIFGGGGGGAAAGAGGAAGAAGGAAGAASVGTGAGAAGAGAAAAGGTAATGAAIGGAAAAGGAAAGGAGAAAATGAAAAIGTKAAAGLATAAIVAAGAAEVNQITTHHPQPKVAHATKQQKPDPTAATDPQTGGIQAPTAAATPPPATAPATTPPTTTVPAQPGDPNAAANTTGGLTPVTGKHKKHKGALANTDTTSTSRGATQTGPVTTGVDPSTSSCDANGDGAVDPGAPASCSSTGAATGIDSGTAQPPAEVTKYERTAAKKKVRRGQARGQSPSAGGKGTARRKHASRHG